jgi:hypothetical protein
VQGLDACTGSWSPELELKTRDRLSKKMRFVDPSSAHDNLRAI